MRVDPYLQFHGQCDAALAFYAQAIGAEVRLLTRFGEIPGMASPPGAEGRVMHAVVQVGEATLLATDGGGGAPGFQGFALALSATSDGEAEALFAALGDGGQVVFPMAPSPFASRFGILTDRFGVTWNVICQAVQA